MKRILLAASILVLTSSTAFAFGLPSIGESKSSSGLSADQIQDQFGKVSKDYTAATKNFMMSTSTALDAFESKSNAATLKSEANQLGSGTISSEDVEKRTTRLQSANDEVASKIKKGEKLSAAGKAKLQESMVYMGKGIATEVPLIATVANLSKQTVDSMKSISVMKLGQVKGTATVLTALSSNMPKDLKLAKDTLGLYIDYAKSNHIEIPKDASDVFASK